jgi:ABC-type nitrate/sulfonate/bicarbonate transport system substrate-binding protein
MSKIRFSFACASALLLAAPSFAQTPEPISIVIFGPPSLGAFLPPVIKAQKLDEKNGLAIKFEERTPDAYTAQFNSGEFQLGGSASLLTVGLADIRGVRVTYLFNLFDFWGAVVTSRPDVKTLKDLEGKDLAAAKGTTNYVMFDWFARQLGADTAKFSVINTATPGLVGYHPAVEEERYANDRPWHCRQLEEIHRQPQHSLSRRRRPHRLGGKEPEADSEALRGL